MSRKQRALVAEAERQSAVALHRLIGPFNRENTGRWRDRVRIHTALEKIRAAADEASLCLELDEHRQERLAQASKAMHDLEAAINELIA